MTSNQKRGTAEQGELIHNLVTACLIKALEQEEVESRIVDLAIKFLAQNGVTRFFDPKAASTPGELGKLLGSPAFPDPSEWEVESA